MGYISHRVDRSEIKAGDHIYTWRSAFTYAHHGIYVGGNKVIHFTAPENGSSDSMWNFSSSASHTNFSASCLNSLGCEFPQSNSVENCILASYLDQNLQGQCLSLHMCGFHLPRSGVMLSCLNCFIGTGSLYLYQYGVSKCVYVSKLRGGTCTMAKSDPLEEVIHRAEYLLQHGFGSYDVRWNNCEDFALYCKTGLLIDNKGKGTTGGSGQVNFMANAISGSVTMIACSAVEKIVVSSIPFGAVAVTLGMHCWDRYKSDIGVRDDVVEVKVEDVGSRHGCKKPVK